jgi:hypothetical protein
MLRPFAALAVALITLAGCGNVAASAPKAAVATPNLPCSLPYGTEVALVSPAPGTSASPDGPIVIVASRDLPRTVTLIATDRKGGITPVATLERRTRPMHAKRAPFADPVYYRATGSGLRAHRHYTLALDDVAQNGCAPYAAMTGEARFST